MTLNKVFLPCRHGLGDVLAGWFVPNKDGTRSVNNQLLGKVRTGVISERLIAYAYFERWYAPTVGELFQLLPFKVIVRSTEDFPGVVRAAAGDNFFPNSVGNVNNVLTNPPKELEKMAIGETIYPPLTKPDINLPTNYIVLHDSAGSKDRCLTDTLIIKTIKKITNLPIIRVGQNEPRATISYISSDIDLTNRLTIAETNWLASQATVIISSLSFLRVYGAIYGTTVIELAQQNLVQPATIKRTKCEYESGQYGINQVHNQWFIWPDQEQAFIEKLKMVTKEVAVVIQENTDLTNWTISQ